MEYILGDDGGSVAEVDDTGGDDLDTGVYGDEFRFLGVFIGDEIGTRDFAGAAQLLGGGVGFGESVGVVIGISVDVFAVVGCYVHCCIFGVCWVWSPMACHLRIVLSSLFPGVFPMLISRL